MAYHPRTNPNDLPELKTIADIIRLPWAGNAAWDVPLSLYVDRTFIRNERFPYEVRKAAAEVSGYVMTGENCDFNDEYTFDHYLQNWDPGIGGPMA